MEIRESSYTECYALMKELWPDKDPVPPIDNTLGMIKYSGADYAKMRPRFMIAIDDSGVPFACTHAYETGPGELRIRGTYCRPNSREGGVAAQLVNRVIDLFPHCNYIYTFPRFGVEGFYQKIGFTIGEHTWPDIYKGVRFAYKYREHA